MKEQIIVKSSNNHYTNEDVIIKENEIKTDKPYIVRHAEHEPLEFDDRDRYIGRVVECDPLSKQIREVAD